MYYSNVVAAARGLSSWVLAPRTLAITLICAATFGVCASIAYAETNVQYLDCQVQPSCHGGADQTPTGTQTVLYRNWNNSCSDGGFGQKYAYTKSYYTLGNGTWVASIENLNYCEGSPAKAHLGPSTNYGYTYVEAKCLNDDAGNYYLVCTTTRP